MKYIHSIILAVLFAGCCNCNQTQDAYSGQWSLAYTGSGCYGKCPVFKLLVFSDGKLYYEGLENTPRIGNYTATASKSEIEDIAAQLRAADFTNMDESYDSLTTDLPFTRIIFDNSNDKKIITYRVQAPKVLNKLTDILKHLANEDKIWIEKQDK